MKPAALTSIELAVKDLLEKAGVQVFKGSYPDFIVYNEKEDKYCLVEVKSHSTDPPSENQKQTLKILEKLGIKCHILHADSIKDLLELKSKFGLVEKTEKLYLSETEVERYDAL